MHTCKIDVRIQTGIHAWILYAVFGDHKYITLKHVYHVPVCFGGTARTGLKLCCTARLDGDSKLPNRLYMRIYGYIYTDTVKHAQASTFYLVGIQRGMLI